MKASVFLVSAIFVCSCSFLNGMDESVKQKLRDVSQNFIKELGNHRSGCAKCRGNWLCEVYFLSHSEWLKLDFDNRVDNYCEYRKLLYSGEKRRFAEIVLDPDNRVFDSEKLNYLIGDNLYPTRKQIISRLIISSTNPNDIKYQDTETPLHEATFFGDIPFAKFLIEHGAKPDARTIKLATPKFLIAIAQK